MNFGTRRLRVALAWGLAVAGLAICAHAILSYDNLAPRMLTVQETLQCARRPLYDLAPPWNLYKNANPAAKEALCKILSDPALVEQHRAAWRMLGHVGVAEDVEFFKNAALKNYPGALNDGSGHAKTYAVQALFRGLGLMARRKVGGAEELLKQMADRGFWQNGNMQWDHDVVLARNPHMRKHDMTLCAVLIGFGMTETKKGVADMAKGILDGAEGPKHREYLADCLEPERALADAAIIRKLEAKPFSKSVLHYFQTGVYPD
jgi:hypothetical protein